jgi:hypothetical protein
MLRPSRLYELKNGSILEFGRVRAIYRVYCPDDTVIPETPAPLRQKVTATIIPNTPDSSLVSILYIKYIKYIIKCDQFLINPI